MKEKLSIFMITALLFSSLVIADMTQDVIKLQQGWAKANYATEGKAQKVAFESLLKQADAAVAASPNSAELLTWRGIINSTYAGVKGGLGAMKYAKASKADLEKALKVDDKTLNGSAYISLGVLYFKVPGWPIGFGDDDKAKELLEKGLKLSPDGIDNNYFYGDFLVDQGQYEEAEKYLEKAQQAPARPDRPLADKGRHQEIDALLAKVQKKSQTKNGDKPF
jgi:tetratricopeptide (TPR) repeat protein